MRVCGQPLESRREGRAWVVRGWEGVIRGCAGGLLLLGAGACTGVIQDRPVSGEVGTNYGYARTGIARLSQAELRATVTDLAGFDPQGAVEIFPVDQTTPFDNDYTTQIASRPLVEAARAFAGDVARRVTADPALRSAIVPCAPAGPDDAVCMRTFIEEFGRRAMRRPLSDEEVLEYLTLQSFAVLQGDFFHGAELVLRAMLQDPEFLYRFELGLPVHGQPNLFRLNDFEIASRLSYFLWGTGPDDSLLDAASMGALSAGPGRRTAAIRLLNDERSRARIARFHAMWLGYDRPSLPPELAGGMRAESDALIDRTTFDEPGSWFQIFQSEDTFVDDGTAAHYGLTPAGGSAWVSYGDTGRQGILSHGTFLSVASKFGDTSPTQRGILIRTRLLCEEIPPPPPNVNVDEPPMDPVSNCKIDRYAAHRQGGCANCHSRLDPVGFGLENFDETGAYRAHDDGAPECVIEGEGELVGVGTFHGPAELSDLLVESEGLDRCMVTQLVRFWIGRRDRPEDAALIDTMTEGFRSHGHRFDELILSIVESDAFAHRVGEVE